MDFHVALKNTKKLLFCVRGAAEYLPHPGINTAGCLSIFAKIEKQPVQVKVRKALVRT